MNIKSEIRVGNNVTLGYDIIAVSTSCQSFITLHFQKTGTIPAFAVDLDRNNLIEFLARTAATFTSTANFPFKE